MATIDQLGRKHAAESSAQQGAMSMSAQEHTVSGEFLVVGPGEVSQANINFPVTFFSCPAFTWTLLINVPLIEL
jgi:hypothetical protein